MPPAWRGATDSILTMARVFSGVQPTGEGPHIGNYIGAFRRWVDLQDTQDECFYCVVDLHAMTLPWEPKALAEGVRRTAATLIATGIDPERSVLFVQSDVAAHTELAWILTCLSRMGELGRITHFQDKSTGEEAATLAGGAGGSTPCLAPGLVGQGYARLKSDLAEAVVAVLEPFQARYAELMGDRAMLDKLLEGGADKARAVAEPTMALVRERVGLRPRAPEAPLKAPETTRGAGENRW